MSDAADIAGELEAFLTRVAIDRAIAGGLAEPDGVDVCEDCGIDIPADRLAAVPGCTRYVYCQTIFERSRRA